LNAAWLKYEDHGICPFTATSIIDAVWHDAAASGKVCNKRLNYVREWVFLSLLA
jgi:hypothetical protein